MVNFLDLPRELRDMIYDCCFEEHFAGESEGRWVQNSFPEAQLVLVNKQVGGESLDVSLEEPPNSIPL